MKIKLSKKFINRGVRQSVDFCPVALMLKKKFNTRDVRVGTNIMEIKENIYLITKKVKSIIKRIDRGEKIEPIDLDFPSL
jgi:hypothetical protein